MTRSEARDEFYADILCTFAEGGIQMVGHVISRVTTGEAITYQSVTVGYDDDEMAGPYTVTANTLAKAFGLIAGRQKPKYASDSWCKRMTDAYRECEAGDVDAVDATNIVEIALFGEVVFG